VGHSDFSRHVNCSLRLSVFAFALHNITRTTDIESNRNGLLKLGRIVHL